MMHTVQRILIVAPTAYPLGGVAVWLDYIMPALESDKREVWFGAVQGDFHDVSAYLDCYPFDKVVAIRNSTGSELGRSDALMAAFRKVKPDVVIAVNIPDVFRATRYWRASNQKPFKLVSTIHGLVPRLFQDLITYRDVIDHIVVTNLLTRLMVIKLTSYSSESVHYAPYGVDVGNGPTRARTEADQKTLRVLYCGRVANEQKRCQDVVDILTELARRRVKFEFRIAGDGPFKPDLLRQLKLVGIEEVIDVGSVPASTLYELAYSKSDVLLLTSDWETGPIVVWEAMAAGVAIVSSRYQGVVTEGALVDGENCSLFDIGDVASAATCLEELQDLDVRAGLVEAGYQLVNERYSKRVSVRKWSEVIQLVLQGESLHRTPRPNVLVPRGRLDRYFGVQFSARIRRIFGLRVKILDAAGEWPHTHARPDKDFDQRFYRCLEAAEGQTGSAVRHDET